jgi:hypothetical protein
MPSLNSTMIHANAWERETLRVLALADRLGVDIEMSVLIEYDVHDLQRLHATLETASEKRGWWRRLRGQSMQPTEWRLLRRALT